MKLVKRMTVGLVDVVGVIVDYRQGTAPCARGVVKYIKRDYRGHARASFVWRTIFLAVVVAVEGRMGIIRITNRTV